MSFTTSNTRLLLLCQSYHFKLPNFSEPKMSLSDMQLGSRQQEKGKCFLVQARRFPQLRNCSCLCVLHDRLIVDALSKKQKAALYFSTSGTNFIPSIFFPQSTLMHVKVICLGSNIFAHNGASKLYFQFLDHYRVKEIPLKSVNSFGLH